MKFETVLPIFRIFDETKAKEFYVNYLGFQVEWEHRFGDNMPLYMEVRRGYLRIHLSEHHGDGSPGASVRIHMTGVEDLHRELTAKNYKYMRPGIQDELWGEKSVGVIDPLGIELGSARR